MSKTRSGRTVVGRVDSAKAWCYGCSLRITVGEPRGEEWSGPLHSHPLTQEQVGLLLRAAQEFDDLTTEAMESGEIDARPSFVAFVDWLTPDLLGVPPRLYEADGGLPIKEGYTRQRSYLHRHPDPLPIAELSSAVRRMAG